MWPTQPTALASVRRAGDGAASERDGDLLDRRADTLERGLAILAPLARTHRVSAGRISDELGLSRSATYYIHPGRQAVLVSMAALESFAPVPRRSGDAA